MADLVILGVIAAIVLQPQMGRQVLLDFTLVAPDRRQ
jgi:hypothetical protein